MSTITGTAGDDRLHGGLGDTVVGLGGNDTLTGSGNTVLDGGDGDDLLISSGGDRIIGGAGNNRILVQGAHSDVAIQAGSGGRDTIQIQSSASVDIQGTSGGSVTVTAAGGFMMTGGLTFSNYAYNGGYARWSLGYGQDVIELHRQAGTAAEVRLGITLAHFVAGQRGPEGDEGDILNLRGYLEEATTNWIPASNPFYTGHLRLVETINSVGGKGTGLDIDFDGGGDRFTRLVDFIELPIGALTARNFAGYAPDGSAIQGFVVNGVATNPAWQTGAIDNDFLYGGVGPDTIHGFAGADLLRGAEGDDAIYGDEGADSLEGGSGANYLRGGEGDDRITGGSNFDDINGNMGSDTAAGGLGDDWVVGGKDNDNLAGEEGDDIVYGNLGNDRCDGGDGKDLVRGGQDNDVVLGQAGDDWLSGDRGNDTIAGGTGADIFHTFGDAGIDRVVDFNLAEGDRVQIDLGTTYTIAQSGSDTVISMGGGGEMILVGVSLASLTGSWIFDT